MMKLVDKGAVDELVRSLDAMDADICAAKGTIRLHGAADGYGDRCIFHQADGRSPRSRVMAARHEEPAIDAIRVHVLAILEARRAGIVAELARLGVDAT